MRVKQARSERLLSSVAAHQLAPCRDYARSPRFVRRATMPKKRRLVTTLNQSTLSRCLLKNSHTVSTKQNITALTAAARRWLQSTRGILIRRCTQSRCAKPSRALRTANTKINTRNGRHDDGEHSSNVRPGQRRSSSQSPLHPPGLRELRRPSEATSIESGSVPSSAQQLRACAACALGGKHLLDKQLNDIQPNNSTGVAAL